MTNVNPLIGTLKLHSNSNTVIDRLAVDVDGWSVTFGTVKRGLSGLAPPRCTKYAHLSTASVPTLYYSM